jgi:hypothetical protein
MNTSGGNYLAVIKVVGVGGGGAGEPRRAEGGAQGR